MLSSKKRLESLSNHRQTIESQIAGLERLIYKCNQDILAETNAAKRNQLNRQIDNYSQEIDERYDKLEEIEEKINKINLDDGGLNLENHLENPKNQQQLNIDESLCYLDFENALITFQNIKSQFSLDGDLALFFIEEKLIKRGDLYLQRLRKYLHLPPDSSNYRRHFRYCPVKYTSGNNLELVMQALANFFKVEQEEFTAELVIQKIGDSLHNNSVLFIEIECNLTDPSEIDPLIPWFINYFWRPLRKKIDNVAQTYRGIEVVAVITSDFSINERLSQDDLICYYNEAITPFARDKLVRIPLENWTKNDIENWLVNYNEKLDRNQSNKIANQIYNITGRGSPNDVCFVLQEKINDLIHTTTSC